MGIITKFLWFGTRAGAAGGAVYLLNEEGVFGQNTDANKICKQVAEYVPQECTDITNTYVKPYLPSTEHLHLDLRQHWNSGVLFTFQLLANLPENCNSACEYTSSMVAQLIESSSDGSEASKPKVDAAVKH